MPLNNDIELRCEEVQEVMNRIPPAIQLWGITVMALIVVIFFAIAYYVEIPVTEDCTFTMDAKLAKNIIYLSPSALQSLKSKDTTEVRLHSDQFPDEFSSGFSIVVTLNQASLNSLGYYEVIFKTPIEIQTYLSEINIAISGTASIIVTHQTLSNLFKLNRIKPISEFFDYF